MNTLRLVAQEIVGLFLDDEFLAVAALVVVGVAAVLVKVVGTASVAAGGFLLAGCVGVLLVSVWRTAQPR